MRRVLSRRTMPDTQPIKDYLCVTMPLGGNVRLIGDKPTTMNYVKMSSDGRNWQDITNIDLGAGDKVYIKGSGSAFGKNNGNYSWQFQIQGTAFLSGNIMSLLYDDDFEDKTIVGKNAFAHLFSADSVSKGIANISNLKLPATEVGDCAYINMFAGTSNGSYFHPFTKTPKLPATTLGIACYKSMFAYSKVDEMPDLPATTLAEECYSNMFQGCSIKEVKVLPATTLATDCYKYMFANQLTDIHIPHNMLPATNLAAGCYEAMFSVCTKQTSIPSDLLPATTHIDETTQTEVTSLAARCYSMMFSGCSKLTYIPDRLLLATKLAYNCYNKMFQGCTALTRIPRHLLPATTLAESCYQYMFAGCTAVTSIPQDFLPATTLAKDCYAYMFQGCTGITELNANLLPATEMAYGCYKYMFSGTKPNSGNTFVNGVSIEKIPQGLLHATSLNDYCYEGMFAGCSHLNDIASPIVYNDMQLSIWCFSYMFKDCTSLVHVDKQLIPTSKLSTGCCSHMFDGCTNLTNTIKFTNVVADYCYNYMYNGCTSITDYEELSATDLAAGCYEYMFSKTGIRTLENKELPANLKRTDSYVYEGMFYGCERLTTVPANFIKTDNYYADACCKNMFSYCTSLTVGLYLNPTVTQGSATIAAANAFYEMFAGCSNLTRMAALPNEEHARLPFTWVYGAAYAGMFSGCRSLTEAPTIDVQTLAGNKVFTSMFAKCEALTELPEHMFKYVMSVNYSGYDQTFDSMFIMCYNLTDVPEELISNQVLTGNHYACMFQSCTSLVTPPKLPNGNNNYRSMFQGCTSLTSIATISDDYVCYCERMYFGCTSLTTIETLPKLTSTKNNIRDYTECFMSCSGLASVPTIKGTDIRAKGMFSGCSSLTSVDLDLTFSSIDASFYGKCESMFADCGKVVSGGGYSGLQTITGSITVDSMANTYNLFGHMFQNCYALATLPNIVFNTNKAGRYCFYYMFAGCYSITEVPSTFLESIEVLDTCCCYYMFNNCLSLTEATTPPAVEGKYACYDYMFKGCTNLAKVHCMLDVQNKQTSYTSDWLYGVAQTGTFYSRSGSDWARSVNGIPADWTVNYVNN